MNQNLQSGAPSGRRLCPEDVVIIVAVGIGFVGSVIILALFNLPSIMVAVFLATGVASLVYRFLGGIESATFNLGPVKLAGTIAALIGCAWFINEQLEQQTKYDLNTLFDPNVSSWFAINYDGIPVGVEIKVAEDSIEIPPPDTLAKNELHMKHDDHKFMVLSKDSNFKLGYVSDAVLRGINLFDTIERLDDFFVTDRLRDSTLNVDLDPIPFELSTESYGGGYSRYVLADGSGKILHDKGRIEGRGTEIVKLRDKYYLVAVVEFNHTKRQHTLRKTESVDTLRYRLVDTLVDTLRNTESVDTLVDTLRIVELRPYSKFAVGEIVTDIKRQDASVDKESVE